MRFIVAQASLQAVVIQSQCPTDMSATMGTCLLNRFVP
jgi:hypothetical protein